MRHRWQIFILSFIMAVTMWYLVAGREKVDVMVDMRVEFKGVPANMVVSSGMVDKISVRVRSPKGLAKSLLARDYSISLDLSGITPGTNEIPITQDQLPISGVFEVMSISPNHVVLEADTLEVREVPLESQPDGPAPSDMTVKSLQLQPPQVRLRGPQGVIRGINSIKITVPLASQTKAGAVELRQLVQVPDGVEVTPPRVGILLELDLKTKNVRLTREVTVASPNGYTVAVQPSRVRLEVALPASQADKASVQAGVAAVVQLPAQIKEGTYKLPVHVLLPQNGELVSVTPPEVDVQITVKNNGL